jgi:hypothetical protein
MCFSISLTAARSFFTLHCVRNSTSTGATSKNSVLRVQLTLQHPVEREVFAANVFSPQRVYLNKIQPRSLHNGRKLPLNCGDVILWRTICYVYAQHTKLQPLKRIRRKLIANLVFVGNIGCNDFNLLLRYVP